MEDRYELHIDLPEDDFNEEEDWDEEDMPVDTEDSDDYN
jgi:hypothetical protein